MALSLKTRVFNYLINNPIDETKYNKYAALRAKFNLNIKQASAYYIEFKKSNILNPLEVEAKYTPEQVQKILRQDGDNLSITLNDVGFDVKSLEDLLVACDVDETKWEVVSWQCRKWDVGTKDTKQLYSVSAKFKAIKLEQDLVEQKQVLLTELFANSPKHDLLNSYSYFAKTNKVYSENAKNLLELALFDMHFGKLAHREEVGEDYDLKIACKRFKDAIHSLIGRVNIKGIERILLPIGQDLINVDNLTNTTTGGTPQDCDSRFHKIVKTVKAVLIETINELVAIAPVDVVITVGNHDEQTTFMIGEMLEAYYHNAVNVNVYNEASLRKYYQYGVNSIMFTHGNKEKFSDLGMIFAAENPHLWAATTQRFIQMGHFHHNKKVTTLQAQEFQGFQVQILPSLSGSDAWHAGKGYQSLKQAKAFLFNKTDGLIGEFTYSSP